MPLARPRPRHPRPSRAPSWPGACSRLSPNAARSCARRTGGPRACCACSRTCSRSVRTLQNSSSTPRSARPPATGTRPAAS
ncbi:hypothetical protein ACFPRL_21800 [Pseudoclavibacter helvolus]